MLLNRQITNIANRKMDSKLKKKHFDTCQFLKNNISNWTSLNFKNKLCHRGEAKLRSICGTKERRYIEKKWKQKFKNDNYICSDEKRQ